MTDGTMTHGVRHHPARATRHASTVAPFSEVSELSRVVEQDIKELKANLTRYDLDHKRSDTWETAWVRLENAWETVRSELANGAIRGSQADVASVVSTSSAAIPYAEEQSEISPTARVVDHVRSSFKHFSHQFVLSSATHARGGKRWLVERAQAQAKIWDDTRPRLESAWATARNRLVGYLCAAKRTALASGARMRRKLPRRAANVRKPMRIPTRLLTTPGFIDRRIRIVSPGSGIDNGREREEAWRSVQARVERVRETVSCQRAEGKPATLGAPAPLASHVNPLTLQVDDPATEPFVVKPLPWLTGALAPVISSRTMQVHHGCHFASCMARADQLSRDHPELMGKSALDVVRWARRHDTELFAAASEAWNHVFFWHSLTPHKRRPGGELRGAIERAFGDFDNFAHELAAAGAAHAGNGWLWLTANRCKQVEILTTSGAESPQYHGATCLLAIDLWEHAYYFDHQNRCREYLDALIDRRLDWQFAEARYGLVFQCPTNAPGESHRRLAGKRGRHRPRPSMPPGLHPH